MIGYLKGSIQFVDDTAIVLNVSNVGYRVSVSSKTKELVKLGQILELFIHTHVKEDQLNLFGFITLKDLTTFENLLQVSGVGPKIALNILSTLSSDQINNAIYKAQTSEFSKVSGIGKKLAQKIIVELQTKIGKSVDLDLEITSEDKELVEALVSLGFSKKEANVMSAGIDSNLPIRERIKLSLRKKNEK